jgi:hypothetical protein
MQATATVRSLDVVETGRTLNDGSLEDLFDA